MFSTLVGRHQGRGRAGGPMLEVLERRVGVERGAPLGGVGGRGGLARQPRAVRGAREHGAHPPSRDHYSKPRFNRLASVDDGLVSLLAGSAALVLRNAVGWVFVVAGIAMLVLPGQGLLSILAGLVLIDFPGKHRLERRLLGSPGVRRAMNWLRRRAGKPPFDFT